MNNVEIDMLSALEFFDEARPTSRYHATAVVAMAGEDMGIGLLEHHFKQQGATVRVLPEPCTQGTRRGVRLDKWVHVILDGESTYFQVEIKNWSAHAIDGKVLKANASPSEIVDHKAERWSKEWDGSTFRKSSARKVLTPMKPPQQNCKTEPLICYWDAMHPTGEIEPLFFVPIKNPHFSCVWVFSISAYLRELLSLGINKVILQMPFTIQRVQWINRIFKLL